MGIKSIVLLSPSLTSLPSLLTVHSSQFTVASLAARFILHPIVSQPILVRILQIQINDTRMATTTNNNNNSSNNNSWPPLTLTLDTDSLLAECENLEVAGNRDVSLTVLQMACLLFLQDWNAARHLWRRNREDPVTHAILQPWWKVGAAGQEGRVPAVWQALRELETACVGGSGGGTGTGTGTSDLCWTAYVKEIGASYRQTLAQGLQLLRLVGDTKQQQQLPSYAVAVLGFSNEAELVQYLGQLEKEQQAVASSTSSIRTDHVAFLESRMDI